MINSIRLIPITAVFCLALAAMAEETAPIFSDNEAPIFGNTYLIDNIGNNSEGADLTLRIHKKAPFGECGDKVNCPASVIVSGATGNVNMPVDVNVRSLYVGKNPVIDSSGRWIGSPTGLIGPAGPKGDTGPQGLQGLKGDTGPMGPAGSKGEKGDVGPLGPQGERGPIGLKGDKGDKGDKGEAGEGCWFDNQSQRINCAGGTWIDISQLKGPAGERGPIGSKGDQGAKGDKGDQGEPGQGCWYDDRVQRINCAGGTWIPIASLKGPQGERGPAGSQGPQGLKGDKGDKGDRGEPGAKGTVGACRQVTKTQEADPSGLITAFAECASDELVMSGGCSWNALAGATLKGFGPSLTQGRYYCTADRDTSKKPLWGQIQAEAICCKK